MNIKKSLAAATSCLCLIYPFTANADRLDLGDFFIRASVGSGVLNKAKHGDLSLKPQAYGTAAIGFGYYLLDNLRTDITFEYHFKPLLKKSLDKYEDDERTYKYVNFKQKVGNLSTLMLSTDFDIIQLYRTKFFVGAGVGIAQHKTKYIVKGITDDDNVINMSASTKLSRNFSYSARAGVSYIFTDGFNAELIYSWKDYGKTKPKKDEDGEDTSKKIHYRGHNLSVGLRMDL